jgi:hypothetical protein
MDDNWIVKLQEWVREQPAMIARLTTEEASQLSDSRRGLSGFTMARTHSFFERLKVPTLCFVFGKLTGFRNRRRFEDDVCLVGIVSSRLRISSFETRVKITRAIRLDDMTPKEMAVLLEGTVHRGNLERRLAPRNAVTVLSPEMSSVLVSRLAQGLENRAVLRTVATGLRRTKRFSSPESLQGDAIQIALRAFGLESDSGAVELELREGQSSAMAGVPIREDVVIQHDARSIPGYTLVASEITGRAIFEKSNGELEVITANRQPLEEVFGVDLIYLNLTMRNLVMVQYKMLDRAGSGDDADWVYRPDKDLASEIARMDTVAKNATTASTDYRLNSGVFYLKFVKRNGLISNGSMVTPLEHFRKLIASPRARGVKGGIRVSYDSLNGAYMRHGTFIDLLQAGYIGSYTEDTKLFEVLIEEVLKGNRSVVAAIQRDVKPAGGSYRRLTRYAV